MPDVNDGSSFETVFDDILTVGTCTSLLTKLVTTILYRKVQLPLNYENLKYTLSKKTSVDAPRKKDLSSYHAQRLLKIAQEGLDTLELIFAKVEGEIISGPVMEVALILGGTILTPKEVYRIHLPVVHRGHSDKCHPDTRHLVKLLHVIMEHEAFGDLLSTPLGPTNMHVLVRKPSPTAGGQGDSWFLPKHRYQLPVTGHQFNIHLQSPTHSALPCVCHGVHIYRDEGGDSGEQPTPAPPPAPSDPAPLQWFQAKVAFKGFTTIGQ